MPKKAKLLTPFNLNRLKRVGLHAVGGVDGLYLLRRGPTARSWILRAMIRGKRASLGLGSFPEVSLEKARALAIVKREQIRGGADPRQVQRLAVQTATAEAMKMLKFSEAAEDCWKSQLARFKNAKHAAQWINTLKTYAYPEIGDLYVQTIETTHIHDALKPIWESKTETASRVRGRIEAVMAYAFAKLSIKDRANPARWEALKPLMAAPGRLKRVKGVKHHTALPWKRLPEFMPLLASEQGMPARCLEFAIATVARSAEARGATWEEIDMDDEVWTVPPERMKAGLKHKVPLNATAMRLLRELPRFAGTTLLFPGPRSNDVLSDNTLGKVADRCTAQMPGTPKATAHGMRRAFKHWAQSRPGHEDAVSELCLAHVDSNETRAAYADGELLDKRRVMMGEWSRYCDTPPASDNVVPIRREA